MAEPGSRVTATPLPSCCGGFYEQDWVRILADGSFHPGGMELTRRCIDDLALAPGARLLDVGSGAGTTALALAEGARLMVTGIDPSATNVTRANGLAKRLEPEALRPRFHEADAADLPFETGSFDGVLAECVISLLPDPASALREMCRVLVAGGRLAITDMAIEGELPADLTEVVAPWTCLVGARSQAGWEDLFAESGLRLAVAVDESQGLEQLLSDLKRRLLAAGTATLLSERVDGAPELPIEELRTWLKRFEVLVGEGRIRYLRFLLETDPD
jgi:ubiquinone/menaquinone biosynthesis C-methylase UbiE